MVDQFVPTPRLRLEMSVSRDGSNTFGYSRGHMYRGRYRMLWATDREMSPDDRDLLEAWMMDQVGMMTMIERIARALCREEGVNPGELITHKPPPDPESFERAARQWGPDDDIDYDVEGWYDSDSSGDRVWIWKRWRSFAEQAVVVVEAMREPTEAMVDYAQYMEGYSVIDSDVRTVWGNMIDAALELPKTIPTAGGGYFQGTGG